LSKNLFFLKAKLWKTILLNNYFCSLNGGFLGGDSPQAKLRVRKAEGLNNRVGGLIN